MHAQLTRLCNVIGRLVASSCAYLLLPAPTVGRDPETPPSRCRLNYPLRIDVRRDRDTVIVHAGNGPFLLATGSGPDLTGAIRDLRARIRAWRAAVVPGEVKS